MGAPVNDSWHRELERQVREALRTIRFGTVTLVIQDGRVIQIDKHEKVRLKLPAFFYFFKARPAFVTGGLLPLFFGSFQAKITLFSHCSPTAIFKAFASHH